MKNDDIDNLITSGAEMFFDGMQFNVLDAGYHRGHFWFVDLSGNRHVVAAKIKQSPGNLTLERGGETIGAVSAVEDQGVEAYESLITSVRTMDRDANRETMESEIDASLDK